MFDKRWWFSILVGRHPANVSRRKGVLYILYILFALSHKTHVWYFMFRFILFYFYCNREVYLSWNSGMRDAQIKSKENELREYVFQSFLSWSTHIIFTSSLWQLWVHGKNGFAEISKNLTTDLKIFLFESKNVGRLNWLVKMLKLLTALSSTFKRSI